MDREELTKEWLRFADMDLLAAKTLIKTMRPAPLEIICYHCQQSAEKFLKAISISLGFETVKTHDLLKVLDQYRTVFEIPQEIVIAAGTLSQFATKTRYPQEFSVDEARTRNAVALAEKVKAWTESVIKIK